MLCVFYSIGLIKVIMIDLGLVTSKKIAIFLGEILWKGASGNMAKKITEHTKNSESQVTLPFIQSLVAKTRHD